MLEIDARTGFTREFTHVSESGARAQELHISLCAVLMAEACNIGLEPLIKHNIYVYATGGYFEGGTERTKFQFKQ
ncbi:hypothetical protein OO18_11455 [Raoultella ornithinolytica]|nr:hypothetical protein OO18_11455 [Raoultella ornithinolytica]